VTYEDALILAAEAHRGQTDKLGEAYVRHVVRVAERLDSDEARIVALLHDVLEDTTVTADLLRARGVPDGVVEHVVALTRRDGEAYEAYVDRIAGNDLARAVKLADLADNLERLPAWANVVAEDEVRTLRERYEKAREALLAS
jgi:(p)ppGpp synthase/HD superfamily hydrolase